MAGLSNTAAGSEIMEVGPAFFAPAPADVYSVVMTEVAGAGASAPVVDAPRPPSNSKAGPGGKHEQMRTYTPEEAATVMRLVEMHAPRWTLIAKEVSIATGYERTAASVRNYYKRFLASKKIADREGGIKKLNKCQMCGQIKRGHICTMGGLVVRPPGGAAAPRASEPAEGLLALSSPRDGPLLPLAPASLQELETPGTTPGASPLSTLSGGPFSPSLFALPLGSPVVVGPAPTDAPFARDSRVVTVATDVYVVEPEPDDMQSEEEAAIARLAEAAWMPPVAESVVVAAA